MRNLTVLCVLLGTFWWAQARPASSVHPQTKSAARDSGAGDDSATAVAPDAAVLTIKGVCAAQAGGSQSNSGAVDCQTVITRAEFEKLIGAIQPDVSGAGRRQFATTYPRLLVMSHEAEQRGLDKLENVRQKLAYARLQVLSQELLHQLQEQAAQVPDKDVEDYYREHLKSFERATLERILVPKMKETSTGANPKDNISDAAKGEEENKQAMVKEAEMIRERAAAGEDFGKLQRAAYDAAGVSASLPTTKLVKWSPGSIPQAHLSVFDLKPGEVSAVLDDPSGYYIYKLDSKEQASLEEARKEIHSVLRNQRMHDLMTQVEKSAATEMNQAYFGTPYVSKPADPALLAKPESDRD